MTAPGIMARAVAHFLVAACVGLLGSLETGLHAPEAEAIAALVRAGSAP